jgi:photosystem II stability/assembly factor-like uncharacterized protein
MFTKTFTLFIFMLAFGINCVYSQPVANEHSIKFSNSTTATLVGEDGVIMQTTDQGSTWVEQNSGITNALFGNSQKNGISLAAGENGVILRSNDNGENWDVILPGTFGTLNDAEVISSNTAVVCGDSGVVYFSNNAGLNWSEVESGVSANLMDVKFVSNDVGFITGDMTTLLKTNDGGSTWSAIDMSFASNDFNSVEAINEMNLVLVGDNGTIFLSNDGGISWQGSSSGNYLSNFNDVVFFDALNGVIAGDDGLLLKTVDGGNTWVPSQTAFSGDSYDFYSVAFADANVGISTGRDGIEVYTTDGGNTWTESAPDNLNSVQNSVKKEDGVKLVQNYPNPFNPTTNISYETAFDANINMSIYDVTGKVVANLVSGYQKAGSHTVNFNASNLSSGVYFYTLNVSSGSTQISKVMKMILTK